MLLKMDDGSWADPLTVEYVFGLDPDETGPGGYTHFRGEPGFIRFDTVDGRPVLVNARWVVALRPARDAAAEVGSSATEIETMRGEKLVVAGSAEWCAGHLNLARRHVA
jgi:hypothetical protein